MNLQGRCLQEAERPEVEKVPMLVLSSQVPRGTSSSETVIVDDTMWIADEHNNSVQLSDLEHNQCVFCLKCETRATGSEIRGVGISSAKAFLKPNGMCILVENAGLSINPNYFLKARKACSVSTAVIQCLYWSLPTNTVLFPLKTK